MSYAWFHRPNDRGIFVYFNTAVEAYNYARTILYKINDPSVEYKKWSLEYYNLNGRNDVGNTTSLQVSTVSNSYVPREGWGYWRGNEEFLYLSIEDASKILVDLNYEYEPYYFNDPEEENKILEDLPPNQSLNTSYLSSFFANLGL